MKVIDRFVLSPCRICWEAEYLPHISCIVALSLLPHRTKLNWVSPRNEEGEGGEEGRRGEGVSCPGKTDGAERLFLGEAGPTTFGPVFG